jgi:hypothetical protein
LTAQRESRAAAFPDFALTVPTQTMDGDQGEEEHFGPAHARCLEALFVLLEVMVTKLRAQFKIGPEHMGANYTNLE